MYFFQKICYPLPPLGEVLFTEAVSVTGVIVGVGEPGILEVWLRARLGQTYLFAF